MRTGRHDMTQYLLITDLKCPSDAQVKLAASMADVATCIVVPPDTVRVELLKRIDLSNKGDLDLVVCSIMKGLQDCSETAARLGVFSD